MSPYVMQETRSSSGSSCLVLQLMYDGQINIVCKQNTFILLAYNRETEFYSTQGSVL